MKQRFIGLHGSNIWITNVFLLFWNDHKLVINWNGTPQKCIGMNRNVWPFIKCNPIITLLIFFQISLFMIKASVRVELLCTSFKFNSKPYVCSYVIILELQTHYKVLPCSVHSVPVLYCAIIPSPAQMDLNKRKRILSLFFWKPFVLCRGASPELDCQLI